MLPVLTQYCTSTIENAEKLKLMRGEKSGILLTSTFSASLLVVRLIKLQCFMWPRVKRTNTPYLPTQQAARRMKILCLGWAGR